MIPYSEIKPLFPSPPEIKVPKRRTLRVGFILLDTFTLTPFANFVDVLRLAADKSDYSRPIFCQWHVIGTQKGGLLTSSSGVSVTIDTTFDQPYKYDYVAIIGGRLPYSLDIDSATYRFILDAYKLGSALIGLCVGVFALAQTGLLDNKSCAVGFGHEQDMNCLFPSIHTITDRTYIEEDRIITCPGGLTAIDVAQLLVQRHCGHARSIKSLRSLLSEPTQKFNPQAQHGLTSSTHPRLSRAIEYMQKHMNRPMSAKTLARLIGISNSQLTVDFKKYLNTTPYRYWVKMRLNHADWLIKNTTHSVSSIAEECGFYDAAHFCKSYSKYYQESPKQARKNHQQTLDV